MRLRDTALLHVKKWKDDVQRRCAKKVIGNTYTSTLKIEQLTLLSNYLVLKTSRIPRPKSIPKQNIIVDSPLHMHK